MSGKSPGAKRRRLQKDDSSLNDAQADSPVAVPEASTKKRVLEIEDFEDPFVSPLLLLRIIIPLLGRTQQFSALANTTVVAQDDEGETIPAKRFKVSLGDEKVLNCDTPQGIVTKDASKKRAEWCASISRVFRCDLY